LHHYKLFAESLPRISLVGSKPQSAGASPGNKPSTHLMQQKGIFVWYLVVIFSD
jgi:hypothetical protein